jgi:hypothetical protein
MRDALTAGPQHAAMAVAPTVATAAVNVAKSVGVTSYSSLSSPVWMPAQPQDQA